jgi:predicted ribosomally synthesized peptide with nif11-like leader
MTEMERFRKTLAENKEMMEEAEKFGAAFEKLIEYANEKGYNFTVEDVILAIKNASCLEISESDLENVSGGARKPLGKKVGTGNM